MVDFIFVGELCDVYGEDLKDLIFEVIYEIGKWLFVIFLVF